MSNECESQSCCCADLLFFHRMHMRMYLSYYTQTGTVGSYWYSSYYCTVQNRVHTHCVQARWLQLSPVHFSNVPRGRARGLVQGADRATTTLGLSILCFLKWSIMPSFTVVFAKDNSRIRRLSTALSVEVRRMLMMLAE
eukprot:COSAG02_NODE_1731_length_11173_cov_6.039281_1_plen_138_part_10